jgi:hypothetical protein
MSGAKNRQRRRRTVVPTEGTYMSRPEHKIDHTIGRYVNPAGIRGDVNRLLDVLALNFGLEWLKTAEDHPLQRLWARKDGLATTELAWLGRAISSLTKDNVQWTKRQISQIKNNNAGNSYGAIFELLGLSLFCCNGQQVIGASENNPGFDGTIIRKDGSKYVVSLKAHGISSHERNFRRSAEAVDRRFQFLLRSRLVNGVELHATATQYPSTTDWHSLQDALKPIIIEFTKHFGIEPEAARADRSARGAGKGKIRNNWQRIFCTLRAR